MHNVYRTVRLAKHGVMHIIVRRATMRLDK